MERATSVKKAARVFMIELTNAYSTGSISPGCQFSFNHASSGPYNRITTFQPLPGTARTQLDSWPLGAD
jgi:hypothetical protein